MARFGKTTVTGFEEVEKNLNRALENMKINSTEGLTKVAAAIHKDADLIPPRIPRDTGNLRQSRFIVNNSGNVVWGNKAKFAPRGKGKWGGGEMAANHYALINKYRGEAKIKDHPYVICGYTAPYTVYVHEMGIAVNAGKRINWTRPGSGAKFFQSAMMNKRKQMMGMLYKTTNIKGKRKPVKGVKYGATIRGGAI
jgi:hypothetical protein